MIQVTLINPNYLWYWPAMSAYKKCYRQLSVSIHDDFFCVFHWWFCYCRLVQECIKRTQKNQFKFCAWLSSRQLNNSFGLWDVIIRNSLRVSGWCSKFWGYWTATDFFIRQYELLAPKKHKGVLFAPMAYIYFNNFVSNVVQSGRDLEKKFHSFQIAREIFETLTLRRCPFSRRSDPMTN